VNPYDISSFKAFTLSLLVVCIWTLFFAVYNRSFSCQCQTEQESLSEGLAQACFSNSVTDQIRQQRECQHLYAVFIVECQSGIQCQPVGISHEKSLPLQSSLSERQKDTVLYVCRWIGAREGDKRNWLCENICFVACRSCMLYMFLSKEHPSSVAYIIRNQNFWNFDPCLGQIWTNPTVGFKNVKNVFLEFFLHKLK